VIPCPWCGWLVDDDEWAWCCPTIEELRRLAESLEVDARKAVAHG
jgi:hypothetical protein